MNEGRDQDLRAIERLNADFGHELDRGSPAGFAALFATDARYTFGQRIHEGRDAIRAFAEARTACGPRVSRHIVTGLRIDLTAADEAGGISICTTFSVAGVPPITGMVPTIIADFVDRYTKVGGGWLFAQRDIQPIFVASSRG